MTLSVQRQAFIAAYLTHFNGARAAREAGYAEKTARSKACELLKVPEIAAEVKARVEELTMSANEVLIRQTEIARGVMQHFTKVEDGDIVYDFTNAGDKLYLIKKITRTRETRTIPGRGNDAPTVIVNEKFEFEVGDYQRAHEMMMKYHRLLVERVEIDWRHELEAAGLDPDTTVDTLADQFEQLIRQSAAKADAGSAGAGESAD